MGGNKEGQSSSLFGNLGNLGSMRSEKKEDEKDVGTPKASLPFGSQAGKNEKNEAPAWMSNMPANSLFNKDPKKDGDGNSTSQDFMKNTASFGGFKGGLFDKK